LLAGDFSAIGLVGSYNVFDFGKREHTIKERKAQLETAETAEQLTKAKVAANVNSSYFAMQRSRQLSEMRHRLASTTRLRTVSFEEGSLDSSAKRAEFEAELFAADLEYRQALSKLKELMGKN
jgi:Outer membrane efflux protein